MLDNLAMFVHDPNSLPHFALADQGTSQIVDQTSGNTTINWNAFGFTAALLGFNGSRATTENWLLKPITDPHKLALMRCAYQQAVENCIQRADGAPTVSPFCPSCEGLFQEFYANHSHGGTDQEYGFPEGRLCLCADCCWFGWGSKHDVPDDLECSYVGRYCGTYLWILPGGREYLTRLTLAILDYAYYEPVAPVTLSKEVTYYLSESGLPTDQAKAVQQVTALIPIDEMNEAILEEPLKAEILRITERLPYATGEELDALQTRLKQVQDRLQALPLQPEPKEEARRMTPGELRSMVAPLGLHQKFLRRRPEAERELGLQELELRLRAVSPSR